MKTVSENQNKDKKRRMNSFIKENRQWFILLGAIFLFLVLLVVIVWYSGTQKKWNPGTDTFRYIMGVKVEYSPDMKLVHTDGGTMIEDKDSVYSDVPAAQHCFWGNPLSFGNGLSAAYRSGMLWPDLFDQRRWRLLQCI